VAAASSQEKVDFALRHGADAGLVYPAGALSRDQQKALSEDFKRVCGGGADVIYDAVGGDYAEPAIRAMNWNGRFLVIGFPAGIPKLPLNLTLLKSCQIVGVFWGAFTAREPKANEANVAELFDLYRAGKIRPVVSSRYELADGSKAIRELMDRKAQGKVVVTV
jgi:NADPH2:quinone reductase